MRLLRETERKFEYVEEEESKKKKAKASECSGDSEAGASSSGPATAEGEVLRSKAGIPITADLRDSVPETAKRKIADSEPRESEDSKDKKN
jgi:hypothetical protein